MRRLVVDAENRPTRVMVFRGERVLFVTDRGPSVFADAGQARRYIRRTARVFRAEGIDFDFDKWRVLALVPLTKGGRRKSQKPGWHCCYREFCPRRVTRADWAAKRRTADDAATGDDGRAG